MWIPVVVGCCLTYVLAAFLAHNFLYRRQRSSNRKLLRDVRRVLIVVAHPDDECMFFGPAIIGLLNTIAFRKSSQNAIREKNRKFSVEKNEDEKNDDFYDCDNSSPKADVHILCLSSGDYRRRGAERKLEFRRCCKRLGVDDSHVILIEHSKLPDDPTRVWGKSLIKEIVLRHVEQLSADTVVTFDEYGVSGHSNHRSLYAAMQNLYSKGKLPVDTRVFVLESVNIFRKYSAFLDVPVSYWRSNYCYVNSWSDTRKCMDAMREYRSQMTWYRVLYLGFSRYMIMNTLKRISPTH